MLSDFEGRTGRLTGENRRQSQRSSSSSSIGLGRFDPDDCVDNSIVGSYTTVSRTRARGRFPSANSIVGKLELALDF